MTGAAHTPRPRVTYAGYRRSWLASDIVAGLAACAVVVPQAMAYATIAGLPVQIGLYTCIVPMTVYALLGGSRAMSVSTTSSIATLTATTLVSAGVAAESEDPLGALMTLTLLVGAVLLLARLLRLGALVESISATTLLGFKIGVGVTVAVGQVPKLLGGTVDFSGHGFLRSLISAGEATAAVSWPTVALSAASLAGLAVLARFAPRVPGALVAVFGGIVLAWLAPVEQLGILLIEPVPRGFPLPGLPDLSLLGVLIPGALAVAIMAFLESTAVARGIRRPGERQVDPDQELLALGAANVAGAFFATMPAGGGLSQSAVNDLTGARTQVSTLVTAALALLVALVLGPVLSLLPQATLAAIVLFSVVGLIDIPELVRWWRISRTDFWVAAAVALVGIAVGLIPAVAVGIGATIVRVLRGLNVPKAEVTGRRGPALGIRLRRELYAANALAHERLIIDLATQQAEPVAAVVLDVERLDLISISVLDALGDLDRELAARGIVLHLAALPGSAARIASRTRWYAELAAAGRVHATPDEGLDAAGGTVRRRPTE